MKKHETVRGELTQELKRKINHHKRRFIKLFIGRYTEMLPSLIIYDSLINGENVSIDYLKLEMALRGGYHVVIGETKKNVITILGYVSTAETSENAADFLTRKPLKKEDIHFIIPSDETPDEVKEITYVDNCETGNFVVLKNKTINVISDKEVIAHYVDELAEIVLSRYSIAMQSKIHTFFTSEANDETINQLVSELYNGSPYIKTTNMFDPKDNMHTIDNNNLSSNFTELKREYQNKISELNNMLGINSLAVEKTSGVSDTEAKSNRSYTTSIANIYLSARSEPLGKLNKRFNLDIKPKYNDEVESEFSEIAYDKDVNT